MSKAQSSLESLIALLALISFASALWNAQLDWQHKSAWWRESHESAASAVSCASIADAMANNSISNATAQSMDCNSSKPGTVSAGVVEKKLLHESAQWKKKQGVLTIDQNGVEHYE